MTARTPSECYIYNYSGTALRASKRKSIMRNMHTELTSRGLATYLLLLFSLCVVLCKGMRKPYTFRKGTSQLLLFCTVAALY